VVLEPRSLSDPQVVRSGRSLTLLLASIFVLLSGAPFLTPSLKADIGSYYRITNFQNPIRAPNDSVAPLIPHGSGLSITNKANASDYPVSVTGGQEYRFNVTVSFEIPPNETGTISIVGACSHRDPVPPRDAGCLFTPSFSVDYGPGAHVLSRSFNDATPPVHRDSFASLDIVAYLSTGGGDSYSTEVTVLPVEHASDVVFLGTVARVSCFGSCALVTVDEVLEDPTVLLHPGAQVAVHFTGLKFGPAHLRDMWEIRGDLYPTEYPYIAVWKSYHAINRTGTRNHGPVLADPSAAPLEGIASSTFMFSVRHSDADGDSLDVSFVLDGNPRQTDQSRGPNGTFVLTFDLPPGIHNFSFLADDRFEAVNSRTVTAAMTLVVVSPLLVYSGILMPGAVIGVVAFFLWKRRKRVKGSNRFGPGNR